MSETTIVFTFLGVIVYLVIFGSFGAWVAGQKYRESVEGFLLGVLFGPLGVIVEGLLPEFPKPTLATTRPAPAQASKPLPPPAAKPKPKPMMAEEWMPEFPEEGMLKRNGVTS
jgi:hypothetical protein